MKRDSKLSNVLHILLHLAEWDDPITSDGLADMLQTNPVVIRRLLAGLREREYVRSEKGHGGGWTLSCQLENVTLRDVYDAVGSPPLLAISHRTETPDCLVEQAVKDSLDGALQEAEATLLSRFEDISLAQLSDDFHKRFELHIKNTRRNHEPA